MGLSKTRPGSWHDQRVWSEEDWEGTLEADEWILGDKGFVGLPKFLCKHKKSKGALLTDMQYEENIIIDRYRIIIENLFGWTSKWGICFKALRKNTKETM